MNRFISKRKISSVEESHQHQEPKTVCLCLDNKSTNELHFTNTFCLNKASMITKNSKNRIKCFYFECRSWKPIIHHTIGPFLSVFMQYHINHDNELIRDTTTNVIIFLNASRLIFIHIYNFVILFQ